MDAQRALLDELMGVSRDGERQEVKRKFSDPEVCKFYIQGFCFMEEFQRTKHNYGDCDKEHNAECKTQWEALEDSERQRYPYEQELWEWLEKMMGDLRAKVRRNEERISQTAEAPLMLADQTKLTEIESQIKDLERQSVEFGEQGDIDAAHNASSRADQMKAEKTTFEAEAKQRAQDSLNRYGEQEVCKYSGVIINSEESRLRDHKAGKNYRAWVHAHEKKKELDDIFQRRGVVPMKGARPREREPRDREPGRDRDRERERHRDSSNHRSRDRDRQRDYSSRDRERDRERDRRSSRSDRSGRESGSRHRHRSRSREERRSRRDESIDLPPPPGMA